MHVDGVADYRLWLGGTADDQPNQTTRAHYGLVNIAAFLSQSMKETIKYNACDENNWQFSEHWPGDTNYPITSACGQLGQDYAGYGLDPGTGGDLIESCPLMPRAEISAVTNAKWYGAPGPLFGAPDSALIEAGLPVADVTGYWTHTGTCSSVPDAPGPGHVYERLECTAYEGQKGGSFKYDDTAYQQAGSVEGCVWWGRGVIQTTGRHNFGLLNHFLGRSHLDVTDPFVRENYPVPSEILYPGVDFCSNPEFICSTTAYPELKWIAGLFYWMASVQTYDDEGWVYMDEIRAFVDGGMTDDAFLNSVSGIVNRGCHNPPCGTGPVDGGPERLENFKQILTALGLTTE
jgi:predicted chitinase